MTDQLAPANQNDRENISLERVRTVRSALMKLDLETVRLRINDHNFCMSFPEFVRMLDVLANNCAEYQAARAHGAGEVVN